MVGHLGARILCKEAMQFKSLITFQFRDSTANAKSVLSVLGACVKSGDEIEFFCEGEDDEEDGLYYRSQHLSGGSDGPHVDSNGTQLTFKNILVQYIKYEELGEGYLAFQCHDTTRDGWYFTNGKGIHVNWEKTSDYGATRYVAFLASASYWARVLGFSLAVNRKWSASVRFLYASGYPFRPAITALPDTMTTTATKSS